MCKTTTTSSPTKHNKIVDTKCGSKSDGDVSKKDLVMPVKASSIPVVLYAPNIMGYARILLAFYGLYISQTNPPLTIKIWIFSSLLDFVDGIVARHLNQCSKFGVFVDIAADNILRSCTWMTCAMTSISSSSSQTMNTPDTFIDINKFVPLISVCILSLEWMTMLCVQLYSLSFEKNKDKHWKNQDSNEPKYVQWYFANNFRNPIGMLGIYGLFASGQFLYGSYFYPNVFFGNIPFFGLWKNLAWIGRVLSIPIELWFCWRYFSAVIHHFDSPQKNAKEETDPVRN